MSRRVVILLVLSALSWTSCEDVEKDFRYISHEDLMSSGGERFTAEDITSYGQMLFDVARNQLFVGAKDNLLRFSLRNLNLLERTKWLAPADTISLCQDKGQSEEDCHNYVKVLLSDDRRLFACGTYAFSPKCSWRDLLNTSMVLESIDGRAKCPYNPKSNITALMTMTGEYYVGTPTDFSGSDPAINKDFGGHTLRTHQYDSKWLNEPQFVGSFENDQFVFFVFRESAVEYINCGKRIYSRIARVCKNDIGGSSYMLRDNWTTFVKARLNCSVPGEYPFYYDEIQGMVYSQSQRLLYTTFTTPRNSIAGSAICVFDMAAIEEAFQGPFKHQESPGSAWESRQVDHQYHTQCGNGESRSSLHSASMLRYQLMDKAIHPVTPEPLHTINLERYTLLTAAEITTKHPYSHVLFVATDSGYIKKISVLPNFEKTCIIEIWKPEQNNIISPIKTIGYFTGTNSVYVGTENALIKIPAARCGRHLSRASCLGAQDPMCGWDERRESCISTPASPVPYWIQDTPSCPDTSTPLDGGWSTWSSWEVCMQKNDELNFDDGLQTDKHDKCMCQTRKCNNPAPRNGGKPCEGASISVTNCTVHGGWTAWSGWSACSATCGVAVKWRRRTCAAPTPQHGGRLCVGTDRNEIYCTQNPPCPAPVPAIVEAGWSEWGPWTHCSAPCGGGVRWRNRRCDNPPPTDGGPTCSGCHIEAETCNSQLCDVRRFSAWTPWVAVLSNTSDDGYVEKRFKFTCKAHSTEPIKISSSKAEERYCTDEGSCGVNPPSNGWSSWSPWNQCSVSCGGGYQISTRTCSISKCIGNTSRQQACNTHSCNDGWGCWSEWSECSVTCGEGRSKRTRSCFLPEGCEGNHEDYKYCDKPSCVASNGWGEWSEWSECENDKQTRTRKCIIDNQSQTNACKGSNIQKRSCLDDIDNNLIVSAAHRPGPVMAVRNDPVQQAMVTNILISVLAILAILLLLMMAYIYKLRCKPIRGNRIPSSPLYMSQPNSYVSVPMKEIPKKRKPSFSGVQTSGNLTLSKANNINCDKNHMMGTPKLYPKSMAADYETSTMKRNSHNHGNGNCRNNLDLEQEKFY